MKYCTHLVPDTTPPSTITIGTFDGLHIGHQALLAHKPQVVVSFDPHPTHLLTPATPAQLIYSVSHRLHLLTQYDLTTTILLPFNTELASQTAAQFLASLHAACPIQQLILGHDARLGCDLQTPEQIARLGFPVRTIPPILHNNQPVSSTRIRSLIAQGNLQAASHLLGRPYSIRGRIVGGHRLGRQLGHPTANIRVDNLALLPYGIYAAQCLYQNTPYPALAYLGEAPTVYRAREPLLEAHFLTSPPPFTNGDDLEIIPHQLLRPDKKFDTLTELVAQMDKDRQAALDYWAAYDGAAGAPYSACALETST
jgi:riboflavin kinase/FMN adenylyltransferase